MSCPSGSLHACAFGNYTYDMLQHRKNQSGVLQVEAFPMGEGPYKWHACLEAGGCFLSLTRACNQPVIQPVKFTMIVAWIWWGCARLLGILPTWVLPLILGAECWWRVVCLLHLLCSCTKLWICWLLWSFNSSDAIICENHFLRILFAVGCTQVWLLN